jgi:hypothetical protein
LAREPDALAFDHARRDRHLEGARLRGHAAIVAELRSLELDGVRAALERVFQIDLDLRHVILARRCEAAAAAAATLAK